MIVSSGRLKFLIAAAFFCTAFVGAATAQEAGVDVRPNRIYVHEDSKTSLQVPAGWEISNPYRLRKSFSTTVLGLTKDNPRVAVTIVWSRLHERPWSDVIRATEGEDLGEEYAVLRIVYGKAKLGRPTTFKAGSFMVFKVLIDDGPDKTTAGAVYFCEAGAGDNRWEIKIRAVYPQINREDFIKQVELVIASFAIEK